VGLYVLHKRVAGALALTAFVFHFQLFSDALLWVKRFYRSVALRGPYIFETLFSQTVRTLLNLTLHLGIIGAGLLQAGCPSCHLTNNVVTVRKGTQSFMYADNNIFIHFLKTVNGRWSIHMYGLL